jgi:hypothetical protein
VNRAKSILVLVLLATLCVGAGFLLGEGYSVLSHLDALIVHVDQQVTLLGKNSASVANKANATVDHLDGVLTDIGRDAQLAGGVLNVTRQIELDNRADIKAANTQTLTTLGHVDELVVSFDASQKQASRAIQDTSAALLPVMDQTRRDLAALEPAIGQMTPLLQQTTEVASNVRNTTAALDHEVNKLVYPPPRKWYQKFLLDPLKTAAHLITIPISSF